MAAQFSSENIVSCGIPDGHREVMTFGGGGCTSAGVFYPSGYGYLYDKECETSHVLSFTPVFTHFVGYVRYHAGTIQF